jgi:hypothetical protein
MFYIDTRVWKFELFAETLTEVGVISLTEVYCSVLGIEAGTITTTPLFIILGHLNVGRPLVQFLIVVSETFRHLCLTKDLHRTSMSRSQEIHSQLTSTVKICVLVWYKTDINIISPKVTFSRQDMDENCSLGVKQQSCIDSLATY